jgi:hypothetical protein
MQRLAAGDAQRYAFALFQGKADFPGEVGRAAHVLGSGQFMRCEQGLQARRRVSQLLRIGKVQPEPVAQGQQAGCHGNRIFFQHGRERVTYRKLA